MAIRQVVAGQVHANPRRVSCSEAIPEVRFAFQGIGFRADPRQMRYSVRLLGHEPEWSPFGQASEVAYAGLPPGEYSFEVRVQNRDGLCSEPACCALQVTADTRADRIAGLEHVLAAVGAEHSLIGRSPALLRCLEEVTAVAGRDIPVLILGETGTGKGLVARAIHALSSRRGHPFIHVNCGSLPATLVASELFGHEPGAFTAIR
ncbi:MAG: sigma 54-interacting transcriptional regulator [Candidatus Latescibacterota bacterium]